ncbi:MAG: competence/damage-inducible protein A [Desulfotomaculaceae bacterium]
MQAEIVFTGTELLLGEVVNTHAQFLGRELAALGIEVTLHTAVGDNHAALKAILQDSLARTDLLIVTGGLGPTEDDLTSETVAALLGLEMVQDDNTLHKLNQIFAHRGLPLPASIKKQVFVPRGAMVLPNSAGTAPGLMIRSGGKIIILLPGPPRELKVVFENHVKSYLNKLAASGVAMHSIVLKVTGLSESQVQDRLQEMHVPGNPTISYVAIPGEVHVRVTARAGSQSRRMAEETALRIAAELSDYVFGQDDELLNETVSSLLLERGLTISAAESCTGGQVMKLLTDVPGSSRYFLGGIVSYSNELKTDLLGVPGEVIASYGAVSEQTARAMAEGICRVTGSSFGLGVTGIAGPEGETPGKPVGLVYIALAAGDKVFCKRRIFPGLRTGVRAGATNTALNMVRQFLLGLHQG